MKAWVYITTNKTNRINESGIYSMSLDRKYYQIASLRSQYSVSWKHFDILDFASAAKQTPGTPENIRTEKGKTESAKDY